MALFSCSVNQYAWFKCREMPALCESKPGDLL